MKTERLNCDNHRNDVFGEVIAWMYLPKIDFASHFNKDDYMEFPQMTKYEF